jgi:hypothetical protein
MVLAGTTELCTASTRVLPLFLFSVTSMALMHNTALIAHQDPNLEVLFHGLQYRHECVLFPNLLSNWLPDSDPSSARLGFIIVLFVLNTVISRANGEGDKNIGHA